MSKESGQIETAGLCGLDDDVLSFYLFWWGRAQLTYLRKRRVAKQGIWVRVTADKIKDPRRLDNFRIEVDAIKLSSKHNRLVETLKKAAN